MFKLAKCTLRYQQLMPTCIGNNQMYTYIRVQTNSAQISHIQVS